MSRVLWALAGFALFPVLEGVAVLALYRAHHHRSSRIWPTI